MTAETPTPAAIGPDSPCPCGSGQTFGACCGPILAGGPAPSPEAGMRARYSAFVTANIDHLERSLAPEARHDFQRAETETWARTAEWQGLEIRGTTGGGAGDTEGTVEFTARFTINGKPQAHHERSRFRKEGDGWFYVDGAMGQGTVTRTAPKVGRNDPCPCGSGKKYKKCHGA